MTHLDGHTVPLVRKGITQPGEREQSQPECCPWKTRTDRIFLLSTGFVQTIKGEGMPEFERSSHGDLFIEYNVVLPLELSTQTRRSASFRPFGSLFLPSSPSCCLPFRITSFLMAVDLDTDFLTSLFYRADGGFLWYRWQSR